MGQFKNINWLGKQAIGPEILDGHCSSLNCWQNQFSLIPKTYFLNGFMSTIILNVNVVNFNIYDLVFFINFIWYNINQVETDGLYNHEQDENLRQDNDVDDDAGLNTRGLVTEHNKKKKKSGGFQSMGI